MKGAKAQLQDASLWLLQHAAEPDAAIAGSHDYLNLMALTGLAYMWARIAKAAAGKDDPFHAAKLTTGRYFIDRILPEASGHLAKLKAGADALMALPDEAF
ncbi:MAG: acyl-CoA dehydrogenase C-terminal domain-containing protein [Caulobacteraceae bacterium]